MIKRHDPALVQGLLMSFCISHPDDVRCAGILLVTYVSARKYAEAVEVLDHFSYPECRIDTIDCPEWGIALTVLQKDEEFKKTCPDAYERVARFLDKFDHRF